MALEADNFWSLEFERIRNNCLSERRYLQVAENRVTGKMVKSKVNLFLFAKKATTPKLVSFEK